MELTLKMCIALISFLYLSIITEPASAKCSGQWAHHMCWGGNGKRSDPNLDLTNPQPSSLLRRVLFSKYRDLENLLQNEQPESQDLIDDRSYVSPSYLDSGEDLGGGALNSYLDQQPIRREPDMRQLRTILEELKLQHALRENSEDLM